MTAGTMDDGMDPKPQRDWMSAYLDQELQGPELEAFETYLEATPGAREELEELRTMLTLVSGLPTVGAPADFYEKLSRRIRRRGIFQPDSPWLNAAAVPFQVLSIMVILTVAALYMMAELDERPVPIEREASPKSEAPLEADR